MSLSPPPKGHIIGKFLNESKNRFRCIVEMDGMETICYIASSCRLDNFVQLNGKEVLLRPTVGKNAKAKYTVCGFKYRHSYILLNSMLANRAVENSIKTRRFSFVGKRSDIQREHNVEGYKTDIYVPNNRTIIEIKSLISTEQQAKLGTVHSDRFLRQLSEMEKLLKNGYNVHLFIVSLNPYTKAVELPHGNVLADAIIRCKQCGLAINAFSCRIMADGEVYIQKKLPIYE